MYLAVVPFQRNKTTQISMEITFFLSEQIENIAYYLDKSSYPLRSYLLWCEIWLYRALRCSLSYR